MLIVLDHFSRLKLARRQIR